MPLAMRRILLIGATGLVGGELLRQLLQDGAIERVDALVRRPLDDASLADLSTAAREKLVPWVADFERLDEVDGEAFGGDAFLCALGTTRRQAGSAARFRQVDYELPLAVARRAAAAERIGLVSALGADPDSRLFYNRVKGEIERDLAALGRRRFVAVRPSFLLGQRRETRLGETLGKELFRWIPGEVRSVPAADVAAVLLDALRRDGPAAETISSAEIRRWVRGNRI